MNKKGFIRGYIIVLLFSLTILAIAGGVMWPYTINSWCEYFDKRADVTFFQGVALGFVPGIGQLSFPGAAITWVSMRILDKDTANSGEPVKISP